MMPLLQQRASHNDQATKKAAGVTKENVIVLTSRVILHIPYIGTILDAHVCPAKRRFIRHAEKIAGWGAKPSGQRARRLGQRYSLPVLNLEDGFLRSFGTGDRFPPLPLVIRSEEHTSELQSLMRISYAVFCLQKK